MSFNNIYEEPWKNIEEIIKLNDSQQLEAYLNTLTPPETALSISRLSQEDQTNLLTLLNPTDAAQIIEGVSDAQAVDLIEDLPPKQAADIVDEMQSDQQADLLAELDTEEVEAILREMSDEAADDARQLLNYPSDTAGGLMVTEYLAYKENLQVGNIVDDMSEKGAKYFDYNVQYAYITSDEGKLVGILRLKDLLFTSKWKAVTDIMLSNPLYVCVDTPLDELQQFFDKYNFFAVPVVDEADCPVGVVQRTSVKEALDKQSNKTYLQSSGIVAGEELRTMPIFSRSFRRLSWLSINIVLNIIAAGVIAYYQDTLEKAIVLAVFLPIISDMSGCSGNQAVAVSIRELTLGLVRTHELFRVFVKEAVVGIINGLILGGLLGGAAILWKGNPYLGLVVATALAINTLVAVSLGGLLPLILKKLKLDPALVSGPVLTTVTDMCGFFFVLGFANVMLHKLNV